MNTPQNTPKPVSRLRLRLRRMRDGSGHDQQDRRFQGHVQADGRVDQHLDLLHADVHGPLSDGLVHDLAGDHPEEHADIAKDGRDGHALGDDEFQDFGRGGTDGFPDAELVGALLHGDEHDIGDAHDAAYERQEAQDPQEGADDPLGVVHLHVVRIAVVDPDTPPVVRRDIVPEAQGAAVSFFEGFIFLLGLGAVHREGNASDLVAGIVDAFIGGVGDGAGSVHVGFVGMVDAHHPERDRSGAYPFAHEGLRVFRRKLLGLRETQDDHFPPFLQVVRVQEPAGVHLDLVLLLVFGQHAGDLPRDRVAVQAEGDSRRFGLAGDVAYG